MIILSLGSNIGDKRDNLLAAIKKLEEIKVYNIRESSFYETLPLDCPVGVENFINMVISCEYDKSSEELLSNIHNIEYGFGRRRKIRNEPRVIDIDIIFFNNVLIEKEGLIIPHPRMHQREFVLQPLCELDDNLVHPVFQKTVRALYQELSIK